ncbi:uncharacterized protein LOC144352799 [Saccoglossus kowalevskii]
MLCHCTMQKRAPPLLRKSIPIKNEQVPTVSNIMKTSPCIRKRSAPPPVAPLGQRSMSPANVTNTMSIYRGSLLHQPSISRATSIDSSFVTTETRYQQYEHHSPRFLHRSISTSFEQSRSQKEGFSSNKMLREVSFTSNLGVDINTSICSPARMTKGDNSIQTPVRVREVDSSSIWSHTMKRKEGGDISIQTPVRVREDDSSSIWSPTRKRKEGGDIFIQTPVRVREVDSSSIWSPTRKRKEGGDISIQTPVRVTEDGSTSIQSPARRRKGDGDISIRSLTGRHRKRITDNSDQDVQPLGSKQVTKRKLFYCVVLIAFASVLIVTVLFASHPAVNSVTMSMISAMYSTVNSVPSPEFIYSHTGITQVFVKSVFGQDLVNQILPSAILKYMYNDVTKPLVLSFHGWTGTGKTLVTSVLIEELFIKHNLDRCAHRFISSLDFASEDNYKVYNTAIMNFINSTVKCKVRLLVFDEIDIIPKQMIPRLHALFSDNSHLSQIGKSICILESNLFGHEINRFMVKQYFTRSFDSTVSVSSITEYIKQTRSARENFAYNVDGESVEGYLWYSELESVIDQFIPFLPMTKEHVRQCILNSLREKGISAGINIETILDQLQYFPADSKLFSVSGCKKVSAQVDVFRT